LGLVSYLDSLWFPPLRTSKTARYIPFPVQGSELTSYAMTRTCSLRQFLFWFFVVFCLLMIIATEAVLRYRLQASDSHPLTRTSRPLQNPLPSATNPVTSTAPGALRNPKTQYPPLSAPGSNYGLSHTECRTEFPGLFDELDRSVAVRRDLGNVSTADIDLSWKASGAVRVMIYNHKVNFIPRFIGS
jgi:hypothetical protein